MNERGRSRQKPLFTPELLGPSQTSELANIKGQVNPYVELWLITQESNGNLGTYLDGLKAAGLADDLPGLIRHTSDNFKHVFYQNLPIPRVDSAVTHSHQWRRLKNILESPEHDEDAAMRLYGLHGTTSHYAVRELMRGFLPSSHSRAAGYRQEGIIFSHQVISDKPYMDALHELPKSTTEPVEDWSDEISTDNVISDNLLSFLKEHRDEAQAALQAKDVWAAYRHVEPLYAALLPIFGEYASRLKGQKGKVASELLLPTFLNWATATLHFHKPDSPRLIFPELSVLEKNTEAKSGRVDGLEIISKLSGDFTDNERNIVRRISRERQSSVISAVREIEAILGEEVSCRILEYKFDVGDDKRKSKIIAPEEIVGGPVYGDRAQLENYLTFASLAESGLDPGQERSVWPISKRFTEGGDLFYWMHMNKEPNIFHVWLSPEEQADVFRREHTNRLDRVRQKAIINLMTNLNVGSISSVLEGKRPRSFVVNETSIESTQNQLAYLEGKPKDIGEIIRDMVESKRQFVDQYGVIEYAGEKNNGKVDLRMNYQTLLELINNGVIDTDMFNAASGGKVACIMPDHADSTPSMMIYLDKGVFHCFGCQAHGTIIPSSMSLDVAVNVRKREIERKMRLAGDKEIPDQLYKVMTFAQEVLRYSFAGSPAERYLLDERGIDAETADTLGVGYCDEKFFIQSLLNEGYSIEMLKEYGLITIGRETGRLYSLIGNRVTFPLADGENLVNNFYGRALSLPKGELKDEAAKKVKRFKHRKINSKSPHGVFNAQALESDEHSEIIVVEGCMDALSLYEMGEKNVVAIVGTGNEYGFRHIVESGKDIALAFDNDVEGGKARERTEELLKALEYEGNIRDYTSEFVSQHPDAANFDDYNSYWNAIKTTDRPRV